MTRGRLKLSLDYFYSNILDHINTAINHHLAQSKYVLYIDLAISV